MKRENIKYIWRLIGGGLFLFGANFLRTSIGSTETYAMIAVIAGLLLVSDVGIPDSWNK